MTRRRRLLAQFGSRQIDWSAAQDPLDLVPRRDIARTGERAQRGGEKSGSDHPAKLSKANATLTPIFGRNMARGAKSQNRGMLWLQTVRDHFCNRDLIDLGEAGYGESKHALAFANEHRLHLRQRALERLVPNPWHFRKRVRRVGRIFLAAVRKILASGRGVT